MSLKTKKALAKRIKKTGTNRLLRNQIGRRHLLNKKSTKLKRQKKHYCDFHYKYAQKLIHGNT